MEELITEFEDRILTELEHVSEQVTQLKEELEKTKNRTDSLS